MTRLKQSKNFHQLISISQAALGVAVEMLELSSWPPLASAILRCTWTAAGPRNRPALSWTKLIVPSQRPKKPSGPGLYSIQRLEVYQVSSWQSLIWSTWGILIRKKCKRFQLFQLFQPTFKMNVNESTCSANLMGHSQLWCQDPWSFHSVIPVDIGTGQGGSNAIDSLQLSGGTNNGYNWSSAATPAKTSIPTRRPPLVSQDGCQLRVCLLWIYSHTKALSFNTCQVWYHSTRVRWCFYNRKSAPSLKQIAKEKTLKMPCLHKCDLHQLCHTSSGLLGWCTWMESTSSFGKWAPSISSTSRSKRLIRLHGRLHLFGCLGSKFHSWPFQTPGKHWQHSRNRNVFLAGHW